MNGYVISKYDKSNKRCLNDWTSISDVGKTFFDGLLTKDKYIKTENNYLSFIEEFLGLAQISEMSVSSLESSRRIKWKNDEILYIDEILKFCRGVLREEYWGKLSGNRSYIHFGYDYYIYIGAELDCEAVNCIAKKHGLFCGEITSPYM